MKKRRALRIGERRKKEKKEKKQEKKRIIVMSDVLTKPRLTKLERYKKYELCRRYPAAFLHLVRTVDPHDRDAKYNRHGKPFPAEKEYIKELVKLWENERLLIIAKSRQMLMTWLFVALNVWLANVRPNRYIFFKSQKLEHAADLKEPLASLLSRAVFILKHLPKDFLYHCWGKAYDIPEPHVKPYSWYFPNGSVIKPVSQDPDEVRGKTVTDVLSDETAFQPWASAGFRAVYPSLASDYHYVMLSSVNGKNWFYRKWADLE